MKNETVEDEDVDVYQLILKLRHETLLVRTEKRKIEDLNRILSEKTHEIIRDSWITTKQRLLLYQRESTIHNYQKVDHLLKSEFIDAKQRIGFQTTIKLGNLLQVLRSQPVQLAKWLIAGEQLDEAQTYSFFLENIIVGLYGCLLFSEDIKYMLCLLYEVAKLQLLNCEDPRRIIKQRTCSFKHLYFLFHEVLQSAKFFLSAAMEIPIVQMMSYTDYYLDLDPEKTVMRFKQDDNEVTNIFKDVDEYRSEVVARLVEFTNTFISSLLENVYSFPKSISWLVSRIAKIIEKSFSAKQANAIITELIFNLYICPVIVDPEQYGICNSQVTEITRHNLIQVCQILQSLALRKYEPIDSRYSDVFDLLDKNRVCNFIELLFFDMDCEDPPIDTSPSLSRDIMLFTEAELNNMITILQKIQLKQKSNDNFIKDLSIEEQLSSLSISADNSPKSNRAMNEENVSKLTNFFTLGNNNSGSKNQASSLVTDSPRNHSNHSTTVLVFPIDQAQIEPIGLISEEKIIEASLPLKNGDVFDGTLQKDDAAVMPETPPTNGDLKQSFTFHDEGSIGNTSDNLEAISEAASNHSVDSSIELENEDQNDNLSDMVSANVSGRGTPNISGRDTPSSQVCENDERALAEPRPVDVAQTQPNLNLNRQIRSEIDDKFCKFEIKKLLEGDETISIISETWSTDVLASDNETLDAGESRHPLQLPEAIQEVSNILDLSETQSESAWSTDVMTSDTERLTEVDNDDSISVAQSDDTRSETDDTACGSRRLSTCSNSFVPITTNQNYVSSVTVQNMSFLPPANGPTAVVSAKNKYVVTSASSTSNFQEFSKVEIKNDIVNGKMYQEQTDNNANRVFKALTLEQSESLAESNEVKTTIYKATVAKNGLIVKDSYLNNLAGPSGMVEPEKNHHNRPNEILLSNCSLNSSSSGSSSHSLENKNASEQWENKQWLNSSGSSLNVTLTPSESTSELSVMSIGKKGVAGRGLKPSVSTGAIPKSISFDMSADKGLDDDGRSKRGGFFGKLRMGFKNRRGKSLRNQEEFRLDNDGFVGKSAVKLGNNTEVSDDILAKYRTKPFVENETIKENCDSNKSLKGKNVYRSNSEEVNSFNDIKNKLRLVLSNTWEIPHYLKNNPFSIKNKIETMLRLELGKARRLREWSEVARISEAIRCINLLNDESCLKLLRSMRSDIVLRATYIKYLITSKQELLFCESYLNSLQKQITNDKYQCERYLAVICVKEFLSEQESAIVEFCEEFRQLSLADEKCDLLQRFYTKLFLIMKSSPAWKGIVRNREKTLKITLERFIMNKTYKNSIYPNGDGDRDRDRVLHNHIEKLSKIIRPDHKDLEIDKMYLRECPWLPAQDALRALNVYKTPRDKVKCIVHCSKCIMDLLAMSQSGSSTTADDFMPVLVFVIIKVNPEALLSTIQYVNSFFHSQLFGEEEYWWTQFCAAVEYIKTMDYSD
ncbi:receptor-mediated endocytosis protein 6 homolog [Diabrotica undecimpunctata]|uniref:receptor-mediated endocytosis protein 6 homolog n=1 Tax=Diabrotica undecimpunctata TaxID=50387 RepID=UPI003B634696